MFAIVRMMRITGVGTLKNSKLAKQSANGAHSVFKIYSALKRFDLLFVLHIWTF